MKEWKYSFVVYYSMSLVKCPLVLCGGALCPLNFVCPWTISDSIRWFPSRPRLVTLWESSWHVKHTRLIYEASKPRCEGITRLKSWSVIQPSHAAYVNFMKHFGGTVPKCEGITHKSHTRATPHTWTLWSTFGGTVPKCEGITRWCKVSYSSRDALHVKMKVSLGRP
jgi:hypothetical protein